jgi:8-oxo-dGTP diphosphatase
MKKAKARGKYCYDYPHPAVTVDIVLFHRTKRGAHVLLIKRGFEPFKGQWALPGGFVDENESLEAAAARELREETGLDGIQLAQIGAFGEPGRDPRGHTVSVAFGAVIDDVPKTKAADDAEEVAWHVVARPPTPLAFDHKKILRVARERILDHRTVASRRREKK